MAPAKQNIIKKFIRRLKKSMNKHKKTISIDIYIFKMVRVHQMGQ
jgi:hypothetical protein